MSTYYTVAARWMSRIKLSANARMGAMAITAACNENKTVIKESSFVKAHHVGV